MPWMWAAAGAAISAGGALFGANEQKKAARRAEREAKRLRQYYEQKAGDTRQALTREIDTLRTLRSMDMPAFQQAAATSAIQARRGQDRASRYRQVGRTGMQMRDQLLGDMLGQYLGREQQQMQSRVQLTNQIIGATERMQSQVNQLLMAGGSADQMFTQEALNQRAAAGQSMAQAIGAIGQGVSAYGANQMANQQQQQMMAQQATQNQAQMEGMFRAGAANTYMQQHPSATPQAVQQYVSGLGDLSWMWGTTTQ
jgi:hypothetical protein